LRNKNTQISEDIAKLRAKAQENSDASQIVRFKEILADRNRQVQSQKEGLSALKSRRGSIDSRLTLVRLRAAELEVDKKSRAVDVKFRDDAAVNAMRVQNASAREKILKSEQQVKLLEEKAAELGRVDNPYAVQIRDLAVKSKELKERYKDLQTKKIAQRAQLEQIAADKFKAEKDRNVVRVQKLLSDREALQARLKANSEALEVLKSTAVAQTPVVAGFSAADMDNLQKQNTTMEEIIGNLRENVALLEYKVTTLQRYKDRNK
jgi:hypothetical protein